MNNKYKEWIKIILLPHLITAIFLGPAIIVFWSGGFIGLYSVINVFSELGSLKYYIYIGIPLIFIMLVFIYCQFCSIKSARPILSASNQTKKE